MDDFIRAVRGWKQAERLIGSLCTALHFTIQEMETHKNTFPTDSAKAKQFAGAKASLKTGFAYLEAINRVTD